MPDAAGNIKGIATTGKVGERIEKIFGSVKVDMPDCWHDHCPNRPECKTCPASVKRRECGQCPETCKWGDACADCRPSIRECEWCPGVQATHEISGSPACIDCWEKAYNLD